MELNKYFDHTLLKADATKEQIDKLIDEAKKYDFFSVCINPSWISYAKEKLQGSDVKVCTVIGFPLGAMSTESKIFETEDAIKKGADEVDMVLNIGRLKMGERDYVVNEIKKIKSVCNDHILKVIVETALLNEDEIRLATECVVEGGADFVKTSTGFSTRGANIEDVKIMKSVCGDKIKIKAAGGVSNYEDALNMIDAGANRIGASKSVLIMEEADK